MLFDFITAGVGLFDKILEKAIPDANLRQETARELAQQTNSIVMGQIALNQADSVSPSKFVTWWRPSIGWICGGGLGYDIVLRPLIQSLIAVWHPDYHMVALELDTLLTLLFGMLGLGAYRSFEKVKGVTA
jgi:hypothetical protein